MKSFKQYSLFILLYLGVYLAGCDNTEIATIDKNINNKVTDKHLNIPGTHIYIIPPKDFVKADNFSGFIKGEIGLLNLAEYSNVNYFATEKFLLDSAVTIDRRIVEYSQIKMNGFNGIYYKMVDMRGYISLVLHFGDSTFMVTVSSVSQKNDLVTQNQLVASINSLAFKVEKKVSASEGIRFKMDDKNSRFKFNSINANSCDYLLDTIYNDGTMETFQVIAIQVPTYEETLPEKALYQILDLLNESGAEVSKYREYTSNKVNGYYAFQLETTMQMEEKNYHIYICSVKLNNIAVVIYGFVPYEQPQLIFEIKKLAETIVIK